jgi:predicted proteasome-type protease
MKSFICSRMVAVQFVADMLTNSKCDSLSITITTRGNSEDFYVNIATDTWSEDIEEVVAMIYSKALTSISQESTQGGSFLPKSNEDVNGERST